MQNKPRKPLPHDTQNPTKETFIKCKYQELAYTQKLLNPGKESQTVTVDDLSEQLHASARTNNLETCLRLLALGAKPCYSHPHRGSSPLHVSGQAGQVEQSELLFVYGADPCALDNLGHTPEECARIAGHHVLADRLLEMQYECSDRLSFYLSSSMPDHRSGEHFALPDSLKECVTGSMDGSVSDEGGVVIRSPLQKLRSLSNPAFEDLCQDVFDEIDRRETERAWLLRGRGGAIPFLPNNSQLSHLRNQSRQKLGLLSEEEFRRLVADILLDTKRRQSLSIDLGPNAQLGGTLVPLSDSYNPLIPISDNEYDVVPEEFRQMILKGSESASEDKDSSIDSVSITQHTDTLDPVFPSSSNTGVFTCNNNNSSNALIGNEEFQRLETYYLQCQTQITSVEESVSTLKQSIQRLEARCEHLLDGKTAANLQENMQRLEARCEHLLDGKTAANLQENMQRLEARCEHLLDENSAAQLQQNVQRLEDKCERLIEAGHQNDSSSHSTSPPTFDKEPVLNPVTNPQKTVSLAFTLNKNVPKQPQPVFKYRHSLMDSSMPTAEANFDHSVRKAKRNTSYPNLQQRSTSHSDSKALTDSPVSPSISPQPDQNSVMSIISQLAEQISLLMEIIRSSQKHQLHSRVSSIVSLSQDLLETFPPNYQSVVISPLLSKLSSSTALLSSFPLPTVTTPDQHLDTNGLISHVIEVSNIAKRIVTALNDNSQPTTSVPVESSV